MQLCDAPALNSSRVLQTDTGVQGISFSFAWMYEYTLLSGSWAELEGKKLNVWRLFSGSLGGSVEEVLQSLLHCQILEAGKDLQIRGHSNCEGRSKFHPEKVTFQLSGHRATGKS